MITRRRTLQTMAGAAAFPALALAARQDGMLSSGYIVRRGKKMRRFAEGLALTPRGFERFDIERPFRVASVSKMITAHGFFELIRSRAIDLDADVSDALGWRLRHPAHPDTPITARLLLSHRSGLRNGADFPFPFNRSLVARLQEAARTPGYADWFAPDDRPPGGWFAYSDTNFALLAQMIERVTGARFDRFMDETVFAPAGLDIGYNWSGVSARKRRRAAAACRWNDGAWRGQIDAPPPAAPELSLFRAPGDAVSKLEDYRLGENGLAFAPHGGLRLSLRDMDALARRLMAAAQTGEQGTPEWTYAPDSVNGETDGGYFQSYGLGMQTLTGRPIDSFFGSDSAQWRGHGGDAYGWMTGLWWNAETQTTLVYAVNGMPETDRPQSARTALTLAEQDLVDRALADIANA